MHTIIALGVVEEGIIGLGGLAQRVHRYWIIGRARVVSSR